MVLMVAMQKKQRRRLTDEKGAESLLMLTAIDHA
jgi:hypothetical protein